MCFFKTQGEKNIKKTCFEDAVGRGRPSAASVRPSGFRFELKVSVAVWLPQRCGIATSSPPPPISTDTIQRFCRWMLQNRSRPGTHLERSSKVCFLKCITESFSVEVEILFVFWIKNGKFCHRISASYQENLESKVKLSMYFFNWTPRHGCVLGEWRYSSTHPLTSALDGGEWSASRPNRFTPRERAPGTY
jgi:hypothetical protein